MTIMSKCRLQIADKNTVDKYADAASFLPVRVNSDNISYQHWEHLTSNFHNHIKTDLEQGLNVGFSCITIEQLRAEVKTKYQNMISISGTCGDQSSRWMVVDDWQGMTSY